jgi:hypothetical protein
MINTIMNNPGYGGNMKRMAIISLSTFIGFVSWLSAGEENGPADPVAPAARKTMIERDLQRIKELRDPGTVAVFRSTDEQGEVSDDFISLAKQKTRWPGNLTPGDLQFLDFRTRTFPAASLTFKLLKTVHAEEVEGYRVTRFEAITVEVDYGDTGFTFKANAPELRFEGNAVGQDCQAAKFDFDVQIEYLFQIIESILSPFPTNFYTVKVENQDDENIRIHVSGYFATRRQRTILVNCILAYYGLGYRKSIKDKTITVYRLPKEQGANRGK